MIPCSTLRNCSSQARGTTWDAEDVSRVGTGSAALKENTLLLNYYSSPLTAAFLSNISKNFHLLTI